MAKTDRLLNIVAALQATSVPLTAEELRERVPGYQRHNDDTFRRTFERDKDDLRNVGVPIETVTVEHFEQQRAAYRIRRERYELPDPGLDPQELAALHLAATSVRLEGIPSEEIDDAMRKLGGVGTSDTTGRPEAAVGALATPEGLAILFDAVLERRPVTFDYADEVRHLQPHRLQYEQGHWYVSGHDSDRGATRSFRLDRISGPVHPGDPGGFDQPDDLPGVRLRPWELGDGPGVRARVLLDEAIARTVLAEDPDLTVDERRGDGSVVVALDVRNPVGLRSFVLSHLDRAELLDPPGLRADLMSWLESFDRTADRS